MQDRTYVNVRTGARIFVPPKPARCTLVVPFSLGGSVQRKIPRDKVADALRSARRLGHPIHRLPGATPVSILGDFA